GQKEEKAGQDDGHSGQGQPNGQRPGESRASMPVGQPGAVYGFLKVALAIVAALVVGGWIIRRWRLLMEMLRSLWAALAEFWRKLLAFGEGRKVPKRVAPEVARPRYRSFSQYKNPFFTGQEEAWPPEQILIYTYEALQVWAKEQGVEAHPTHTAREFCRELGEQCPQVEGSLGPLAYLYAHAAYGRQLPAGSDLEPIKELWRQMAVPPPRTVALAAR
ncbi:MAG TPA: DUF4129 domain-containing protein, partial [Candidatus Saccharimonadales bacterium]|nr:DUF4129 domain-containing protein [Candidatus Saccharimonadales bacterium]